ncbi:Ff.00g011440.m01.CDS01 [Fusarium sp. VM40]|nr:Ff.00g011440.m01.CDS01 [Fusarium sp. VM40]
MEVTNQNEEKSFDVKDSDCTKEFLNLINACRLTFLSANSAGGKGGVAGWYWRIDPNAGKC